ncbi:MAG TPA: adenylosuccinate lyase [Actinomycetota bacterium]|nr:adenylosuccinate lyase [Actinomycetota bacterium]
MIARYTRPEMGRLWSDGERLRRWLDVEVAALEAWERVGKVPVGTADAVRSSARIDPERIAEIEAEVHHDVVAFVSQVAETCGEHGRWIHFGLTSYDVVDTAQGMALRDSCDLMLAGVTGLASVLRRRALEFRDAVCMGRTHGIHAEPTTFGAKLAGHAFEFARHRERLAEVRRRIAVGKMAGPVGNYGSVPPGVEADVLSLLGLRPEDAPSQIVTRDRHAEYLAALAGIGSSIERLAVEIRHLARTEVREAEEPFTKGAQKGSSSMPHKRNPWRCERLSGLARLLRGYAHAGWENVATWHERDMSQSSVERVALADASCVCDFALADITRIVDGMPVYPERMRANMALSFGLFYSQHVLLALIESGMERDDAYRIVQSAAMTSWEEERPYLEVLKEDPRATEAVDLDAVFDESRFLSRLDVVFDRLESLNLP